MDLKNIKNKIFKIYKIIFFNCNKIFDVYNNFNKYIKTKAIIKRTDGKETEFSENEEEDKNLYKYKKDG